jgi:bifunctional oligoribonuclease and PAP phosphatase NrnA
VIGEQDWAEAVALLDRPSGPVLVACHISPDGDALGSALGLTGALRKRGVSAQASFSEPFVVPEALRVLPGQDMLVHPAEADRAPALLITVDAGSADRLGSLRDRVETAGTVLVVDHHASNDRFGTHHLVDPSAPATTALVEELIRRLGVEIDVDIATCLYLGLATDTGSFRNASTTPGAHEMAARMLTVTGGYDHVRHDIAPYAWLQLLGDVLARTVLEPDGVRGLGLVWTYATVADLKARDLGLDAVDGVVDLLRTVKEAEVACVAKPTGPGEWSVSLRSRGLIDVGAVCVSLGGGGHRFAAGFTGTGDIGVLIDRVRAALADVEPLPREPATTPRQSPPQLAERVAP